jgi:4-alpha-glucanotransferase
MMQRIAGLMIPLFSLRTADDLGRGEINGLVPMADFALATGHRMLQLLPIDETAPGETSPYSAMSVLAIDPLYISLRCLDGRGATGLNVADHTTGIDAPVLDTSGVDAARANAGDRTAGGINAGDLSGAGNLGGGYVNIDESDGSGIDVARIKRTDGAHVDTDDGGGDVANLYAASLSVSGIDAADLDAARVKVGPGDPPDHLKLYAEKVKLLRKSFDSFVAKASASERSAFDEFQQRNHQWLRDYTLFRALKERFG